MADAAEMLKMMNVGLQEAVEAQKAGLQKAMVEQLYPLTPEKRFEFVLGQVACSQVMIARVLRLLTVQQLQIEKLARPSRYQRLKLRLLAKFRRFHIAK